MSKPAPDRPQLCPICHRPTVEKYRPFCSKHCADVDLAKWLHGDYAVPSVENDAEDSPPEDGDLLT